MCQNGEIGNFFVKFHNADEFPIDISMYDENLNEQVIKSRIEPEAEYSHEAYFYQTFVFKRSENYQRLKANANGVTADVFEGCHFKAKQGRLILVYVSGGNLLFEP